MSLSSLNVNTRENVQYKDISQIDKNERYNAINTIHSSLDGWEDDTEIIKNKYLYKPENYQVFQVAELFDKIIGYVIIREDINEDKTSYLSFIAVHKDYHQLGIGGVLLDNGIEKIKKIGTEKLTLHCDYDSAGFYKKFAEKRNYTHAAAEVGAYKSGKIKLKVAIGLSTKS